jgi:hypothetical protein
MEEIVFGLLLLALAVYIILGNYLYFAKILPALDEAPKFLPSAQFDDADRFLLILDERGEYPWFTPILRHQRKIVTAYVIAFVVFVAYLVF